MFEVGKRVIHNGMKEPGVVTKIGQDGTVHVRFDRVGASGQHWGGVYDKDWFRIHAGLLSVMPDPRMRGR